MKIAEYKNGSMVYRDMTPEEEAEFQTTEETEPEANSETALKEFITGLSTATTISQIRSLAKEFIERTE